MNFEFLAKPVDILIPLGAVAFIFSIIIIVVMFQSLCGEKKTVEPSATVEAGNRRPSAEVIQATGYSVTGPPARRELSTISEVPSQLERGEAPYHVAQLPVPIPGQIDEPPPRVAPAAPPARMWN